MVIGPGSPAVSEESHGKPFGVAAASFQQDVLITDPAGKGRGISAPSMSLPGGYRYLVRVKFAPEKVDRDHREELLRSVTFYEWRGRPGADCASVACWVAVEDFSSERNHQERSFEVAKDTKWLLAIWQLPPKTPEGVDQPPVATCQDRSCWKIEDVQVGGEGGVVFEMATPDQTTTITVLQRPKSPRGPRDARRRQRDTASQP
jgi:hypothetical protein